jgi:PPK2 family polyphosphate:nucleotide phosphotransferase
MESDTKSKKSKLGSLSTKAPKNIDKELTKHKTQEMYIKIEELHKTMRAENKHSLLIVFQGMDASGKDGSIHKLYKGLYPMATSAHSFKAPTDDEKSRDFLWRIHKLTPVSGHITIFNRSHYEDILVPTVHEFLDEDLIQKRHKQINDFEELLEDHNTHVIKFYLHISKDEQTQRFEERKENVEKRWKYNANDLSESMLWDEYMEVYEDIFKQSKIKWNIIPADQKWYRDYLVAKIILNKLKSLKMEYPKDIK